MAVDLGNGATGVRRPRALARRDARGPSPIGGGPLTCGGTRAGLATGPAGRICDTLRAMPRSSMHRFRAFLVLLAAVASLLAPARARAAILGFQANPVVFSPNGDGILDDVHLSWSL